jgi:hypothetical protein
MAFQTATEADSKSEQRLALVADFISAGARVLEIDGASLTRHLPLGCVYRSAKHDIVTAEVAAKYDMIVMLVPLLSQGAAASFFNEMARAERPFLIACRNHDRLGFHELVRLIGRCGLRIEASASVDGDEMLLRLAPARKLPAVSPCSVALLCGGMTFAERLGRQMIGTLLPGDADIHHIDFGDLGAARETYDLVVLGAGQGLLHPLVDPDVLDIVKRGRGAIGLFGTQQRELLPRAAFDHLLDNLDVWFARTRDDLMLFGRGRDNVTYLGDWLVEQFPLGQGREGELLTLDEDALRDLPLDRSITAIQRHSAVFGRALAPFLCALNSADTVAYADDFAAPTGEFRSLMMDVFGRSFPPNEFFQVDRDAVVRYRARVHRNVGLMRTRIEALLRGKNIASAA